MKKKIFTFCAFHLLVAIVAAVLVTGVGVVADEYASVIHETINTNVVQYWSNSVVLGSGAETYPSAYMFKFDPSGTYTVNVDVVKGDYTVRLVRQVITSGTMGTFLPENKVWIRGDDVIQITMPQASATVTNQTTIILSARDSR